MPFVILSRSVPNCLEHRKGKKICYNRAGIGPGHEGPPTIIEPSFVRQSIRLRHYNHWADKSSSLPSQVFISTLLPAKIPGITIPCELVPSPANCHSQYLFQ